MPRSLKRSIELAEFKTPTPIQSQSIPISLEGKDVLGTAQTGTGKTLAFTIPMLNKLLRDKQAMALIICPTRELATQVMETVLKLNIREIGIGNALLIGGESMQKQLRQLKKRARIIVGTPGRINDHLERKSLNLSKVNYLVLDETDRMLDMGFFPDITWVIERMTARSQTLLFSATFPQEILDAAYEFMDEPEFVLTNTEELDIPPIKMYSVNVGRANKLWALSRLLSNTTDDDQIIVFCNTKRMVDLSVQKLTKAGTQVSGLHGDLSQNQRERILESFKNGETKTIIATDVAARGIDVDGITLVVNYDVPDDMDSFIHRIGRTGRIGREGQAWSLVSKNDAGQLSRIIATYGLDIEQIGVPNLPTGIDKDPIAYKDDFMESADVFGFVPIRLTPKEQTDLSSRTIANWFAEKMRCDELAIGDIIIEIDAIVVNIHSSKVSLALKALEKYELNGTKVSAEI